MTPLRPSCFERAAGGRLRWWFAGLLAAPVFAFSGAARAFPEFPGIVRETFDLGCAPPCLLCHKMPTPQPGDSAEQLFANNVRAFATARGTAPSEDSLPAILKDIETKPCANLMDKGCAGMMPCTGLCNSDGEGDTDIVELMAGENPNNASILPCPRYGCGAHMTPERPARPIDGTVAVLALVAAGVFVRRARRG